MILRTVKLIGRVYGSIELTVFWDGEQVFKGQPITDSNVVCSWSYPAKKFGNIPLKLVVDGIGKFTWIDTHMNYTGDYECLPGAESSGGVRIAPKDYFDSPAFQTDTFDGKSEIYIDGSFVSQERSPEDAHLQGAWHYELVSGQTLECKYRVDRKKIRIYSPTFDY